MPTVEGTGVLARVIDPDTAVPAHRRVFGTRSSPLTSLINALLNYLYALLETKVRLAILTIELDSGMGILHADQKSRGLFVFDVIESLRPVIDGYILKMEGNCYSQDGARTDGY